MQTRKAFKIFRGYPFINFLFAEIVVLCCISFVTRSDLTYIFCFFRIYLFFNSQNYQLSLNILWIQ